MNANFKSAVPMVSLLAVTAGLTLLQALQPDKETQATLTPESVLADLKAGNQRFGASQETGFPLDQRRSAAVKGQFPKAYILSCIDSRVPVEIVFDQSIGDLFVGRVAGNIENEDQLGSMEYAAGVAGVKLIVVMGHEACGNRGLPGQKFSRHGICTSRDQSQRQANRGRYS